MNSLQVIASWVCVSLALAAASADAANSATTEMGFSLRYDSLKSSNNNYVNQDFQGFYLKPYRAIWCGGELTYAMHTNPAYSTKILELGGLIKFWMMSPGQGLSLNLFSGFALGKEDNGISSESKMTVKAGPEFAYFILDGVSVSTRLQYTMRRSDKNFTGLGLHSGFSIFF